MELSPVPLLAARDDDQRGINRKRIDVQLPLQLHISDWLKVRGPTSNIANDVPTYCEFRARWPYLPQSVDPWALTSTMNSVCVK